MLLDKPIGTMVAYNKAIIRHHPYNRFYLYVTSDHHIGAQTCDYTLFKKLINLVRKDRKALITFGGDLTEAIPRNYKINAEDQADIIDKQIIKAVKLLEPIKKKIVVGFRGNHNTKMRGESVDSEFQIFNQLKAPYKTVPSLIMLRTPGGTVQLAQGHGRSGAKNGLLELEQMRKIYPGAQAYILGHNHHLFAQHAGGLKYDAKGNEHFDKTWFVRSGSFLKYPDYGRYALYTPERTGFVRLEIKDGVIIDAQVFTDDDI